MLVGTVDFAATDIPLRNEQTARLRTPILHLPTVIGAIVPVYELPAGTAGLRLTDEVLANIYLGSITKWNDEQISAANPGVRLPNANIVVIHRSDGSGSTYVWTDFLARVSPEWRTQVGVGASVKWPTGLGAKGSEGVAGLVKQTPYSIAYLEHVHAQHGGLDAALVRNAAGLFVQANSHSISAAAESSLEDIPDDLRVSITGALDKEAYPVSSFTWLLVPARVEDSYKRQVLKDFLFWMLTDGQEMAQPLGYVALPRGIVERELPLIHSIQ